MTCFINIGKQQFLSVEIKPNSNLETKLIAHTGLCKKNKKTPLSISSSLISRALTTPTTTLQTRPDTISSSEERDATLQERLRSAFFY